MSKIHIWLRDNKRYEFECAEQAEAFIKGVEDEAKLQGLFYAIQIKANELTSMLITIGSDESHTQFYTKTSRPPIATAIGAHANEYDEDHDTDDPVEFEFNGEPSAIGKRYWISMDDAREALRYYLRTGEQPQNLHWIAG